MEVDADGSGRLVVIEAVIVDLLVHSVEIVEVVVKQKPFRV